MNEANVQNRHGPKKTFKKFEQSCAKSFHPELFSGANMFTHAHKNDREDRWCKRRKTTKNKTNKKDKNTHTQKHANRGGYGMSVEC
mmetsp:Transcript_68055/g.142119  ORF Transcript_68055/g.142119 Transcript_68055/m.142119 type:complete len:86 (-) Transcript_68055:61-318(-)